MPSFPLDSKFGFAWRDWRVLTEIAQRTGDAAYSRAAANIARILGERAADKRIETLQDRIHRLHAWWLIDRNQFANKIKRETGALLALQNPDGGWHESNAQPGPSAVYTTGQLVDTLLEIGLPRDHPAVARALRYLLARSSKISAAGSRPRRMKTSARRCARRGMRSWHWPGRTLELGRR